MWSGQRYETSPSVRAGPLERSRAAATKFGSVIGSSRSFIRLRVRRRRGSGTPFAGSTQPPPGTFTCSENEPSVIACEPSTSFAAWSRREQRRHCAVAEVEHEARALVPVVEQVRLAARGDHQHVRELGLGAQQVARERGARPANRRRRCRTRPRTPPAAEAVRDPRRRLPDGIVLPGRARST